MHMRIFLGSVSTTINKFSKEFMTQKAKELLIQNIVYKRKMAFQIQRNNIQTNFWKTACRKVEGSQIHFVMMSNTKRWFYEIFSKCLL